MSNFNGTQAQEQRLKKELKGLRADEGGLMIALQRAQSIYGWLPKEVQNLVATTLDVPPVKVYGVVTFYSQFNLNPMGKYKIGICLGTACYVKGSQDIMDKFVTKLGIKAGQTTPDGKFSLEATRCIGCCGLAPVMTVNEDVYGKVVSSDIDSILGKYE